MKRIPWLRMRKKTDPELPYEPPIWFGNMSNGEYYRPATKEDRLMRKLILETASDNARKVGMDRREFLASAMGMATSLWCLNYVSGCSSTTSGGKTTGGTNIKDAGLSDKDASFCVSKEAMFDPNVACDAVSGHEFIFDVQTHWFNKADLAHFPLYLQLFGTLFDVATEDAYIKDMFCNSDTTIACLTAWPGVACTNGRVDNCGLPLSNESNAASRDKINFQLAQGTQRVLNHFQVMVQDDNGVEPQLALMEAAACNGFGLHAWKMYPGFQPIFTLDDARGRAVIEKGLALGVPLFCVHKGLPIGTFFSVEGNHPRDVGIVAKDYKDTPAKFIVYHSAIDAGIPGPGDGGTAGTTNGPPEGPYDPSELKPTGVNALVRALQDNGIPPNANVFGEIGSAINQVMKDPVATAHFFGKLLKYIGTENVVWGTDCVIYGSPQPFIQWFRTATIPQSMQDQYGYPPLDTAQKAKIFGLNAARIYGVNVNETICKVSTCPTALLKERLDQEVGPNRWMFEPPGGPKNWDEFVQHSQDCVRLGRPG
jgi:hypothetical protein